MSPVRVTLRRTIGRLCNLYSTALVFAGFLAAVETTAIRSSGSVSIE